MATIQNITIDQDCDYTETLTIKDSTGTVVDLSSLTRESHPYPDYANEHIAEIENGSANLMKFEVREGRKYYKVVQSEYETWNGSKYYQQYRDSSVHSFIDKETGEVFKPASWNRPAKHVRYDMREERQLKFLLDSRNVDWAGGYLYLR